MKFPPHATKKPAFTLIEVTLALGVATFCLLSIFGLLPVGLLSNQAAISQTAANRIISEVATDLRTTPSTSPLGTGTNSAIYSIPIPAPSLSGTTTTTLYFNGAGQWFSSLNSGSTSSTHRLTVTLVSGTNSMAATTGNLLVTWPAAAAPSNAQGSVTAFVALDRN